MIILKNTTYQLNNKYFYDAVNGKRIKEKTIVNLFFSESHLNISFKCLNNPYVDENSYYNDNSDLFKQEVFEIFISDGINDPSNYLEIEINPLGAIFIANIHNDDLIGSNLKAEKIEKEKSGITSIVNKFNNSWKGEISIPIELICGKKSYFPKDYRINFFRIISQKSHKESDWENNPEECIYSCWKCTYSPDKPKFHRSRYFGKIKLK